MLGEEKVADYEDSAYALSNYRDYNYTVSDFKDMKNRKWKMVCNNKLVI